MITSRATTCLVGIANSAIEAAQFHVLLVHFGQDDSAPILDNISTGFRRSTGGSRFPDCSPCVDAGHAPIASVLPYPQDLCAQVKNILRECSGCTCTPRRRKNRRYLQGKCVSAPPAHQMHPRQRKSQFLVHFLLGG